MYLYYFAVQHALVCNVNWRLLHSIDLLGEKTFSFTLFSIGNVERAKKKY